jgi:hypothetical protein
MRLDKRAPSIVVSDIGYSIEKQLSKIDDVRIRYDFQSFSSRRGASGEEGQSIWKPILSVPCD